jgi:zinc protease
MRLRGTVIRRNLEPFIELLASIVTRPAFRPADIRRAREETLAELVALRDDDATLGSRCFRRAVFGPHPYGRPITGTQASIRAITRADVVRMHEERFVDDAMVLGFAGDVTRAELAPILETCFGRVARGRVTIRDVQAPEPPRGRRVVLVDKPERTQTQLFIGALGARTRDRDLFAFMVANTVFGGTFSSRLMQAVRAERGYSYGVDSRIGHDRQRDVWRIHSFPSAADTIACTKLELELLETWVARGSTKREVAFAKKNLVRGHCFDVDTAEKRLDSKLDVLLHDVPPAHVEKFTELVESVDADEANRAVKRRIDPRDLVIVVVATAKQLASELEKLPGVSAFDVVPYDRDV